MKELFVNITCKLTIVSCSSLGKLTATENDGEKQCCHPHNDTSEISHEQHPEESQNQ